MNPIKDILNNFGFFTIIPVGMHFKSIEEVAKGAWFLPVMGATLGLAAGGLGALLEPYLPFSVVASLSLFILIILSGFHHLDGLLDVGDGMMVRESAEKRQEAMHDVNTGVGGFALGLFVILLSYLALGETGNILIALVVAESGAKFSLVVAAFGGKASHEGMGSAYVSVLNNNYSALFASGILFALISQMALGFDGIYPLLIALLIPVAFSLAAEKALGGISGDVLGAIHEITRMTVLVVLLI